MLSPSANNTRDSMRRIDELKAIYEMLHEQGLEDIDSFRLNGMGPHYTQWTYQVNGCSIDFAFRYNGIEPWIDIKAIGGGSSGPHVWGDMNKFGELLNDFRAGKNYRLTRDVT